MTLQELYASIDGDFAQAQRTMRIDKLIDKHIRKLPANPIFQDLAQAMASGDAKSVFESAHAIKGVCANLGLVKMATLAGEICDEYREGRARTLTDAEVAQKIDEVEALFEKAAAAVRRYEQEAQ